jgi:hypothetical protein
VEVFTLSSLIGKEILEVRFHHNYENEYGFSDHHTFIKLAGDIYIDLPMFDDAEFKAMVPNDPDYYQEQFESGELFSDEARRKMEGQKIVDFFLCFDKDGDLHDLGTGYILLSNGYYLVDKQHGMPGTIIGLFILDEAGFIDRNKRFNIDARSFLKTM